MRTVMVAALLGLAGCDEEPVDSAAGGPTFGVEVVPCGDTDEDVTWTYAGGELEILGVELCHTSAGDAVNCRAAEAQWGWTPAGGGRGQVVAACERWAINEPLDMRVTWMSLE